MWRASNPIQLQQQHYIATEGVLARPSTPSVPSIGAHLIQYQSSLVPDLRMEPKITSFDDPPPVCE